MSISLDIISKLREELQLHGIYLHEEQYLDSLLDIKTEIFEKVTSKISVPSLTRTFGDPEGLNNDTIVKPFTKYILMYCEKHNVKEVVAVTRITNMYQKLGESGFWIEAQIYLDDGRDYRERNKRINLLAPPPYIPITDAERQNTNVSPTRVSHARVTHARQFSPLSPPPTPITDAERQAISMSYIYDRSIYNQIFKHK